MDSSALWERYRRRLCTVESVGLSLDLSRMDLPDDLVGTLGGAMERAFTAMEALEGGEIANPDEKRMVGHYWLRAPERAPDPAIARAIRDTTAAIVDFSARVHSGEIRPEKAERFRRLLVVGIGGSALGPQLVADALGGPDDPIEPFFFDNTDPDGFERTLAAIGDGLAETLVVVISKSGGTKETRNGMLEAAGAFGRRGLRFAPHAVAVTGEGSELDRYAAGEQWLRRFPMWDWVGGRTSELSAVGLLPARLQGFDVEGMLAGARAMDEATRVRDVARNPAALLALAWHHAGAGRGGKDMVILPYKDRFLLFSRYLQQLVMESLGKELDLDGRTVHQGIAVYGNKGSTDQHAYVQQLRDGVHNFFVTFLQVLEDRSGEPFEVEPGITSGDYLLGFLLGTRQALYEKGRESVTVTVRDVGPRTVGALIALYERAVGFYATLVNVNAYHQPGVEAGKKAASAVLEVQRLAVASLRSSGDPRTAEEIAAAIGAPEAAETVFHVLEHLAANRGRGVEKIPGRGAFDARYRSR